MWSLKSLGEIAEVQSGGTPLKSNKEYWDGDIPWYSSGELNDIQTKKSKSKITTQGLQSSSTKLFPKGSLLIGMYDTAALKMSILDRDAAFNQAIAGVKPKDDIVDLRFILYAINFQKPTILNQRRGVRQKNLNLTKIKKITIPLPPLPEQKRIVAILDEAFEGIDRAIANTQKNLVNAREIFESYLNTIFTQKGDDWVEVSLDKVCSIISKLIDPRESEFINLLHVGAGNIVSKTGELIDLQTAKDEKLKSGKFLFNNEIVLYSKIRPYLMKVCRPNFRGLCSADIYPLLPNTKYIYRDFLFYLLLSQRFTKYAISGSNRAGMPKVNRSHLFKYSFRLPNISEQIDFTKKVDKILVETQRLEAIYQRKLEALQELKQSILHKAFTGELTNPSASLRVNPTIKEDAA